MAGVTPQGFTKKTVEELNEEIAEDQLSNVDATLNLSPTQPLAQINASFAKKAAELWEVAETAYNGFDRDAAEDRQLDNVGSITGTPRDPAKKSLVPCTVNLGAGFSQGPGLLMAHVDGQPDIKFVNRDLVTSVGAGNYTAVFESVDYGPVVANAGTLTEITNPVTGWNSITNPTDAELGSLKEEDDEYRQRQDDELTAAGSSTVDAIRTDLLQVKSVLQAYVFENTGLTTDVNGVPGKAIECVVYDGTVPAASNTEIAQAIWDSKPSGSETYGSITANAVDKLGVTRAVKFSRATIRSVYLTYDLSVDASKFPVDGVNVAKAAAVAKGNTLNLDDDVVALPLAAAVLPPNVAGVKDVVSLKLGFTAAPSGTSNLTITGREIARFDTSRVVVNLV